MDVIIFICILVIFIGLLALLVKFICDAVKNKFLCVFIITGVTLLLAYFAVALMSMLNVLGLVFW